MSEFVLQTIGLTKKYPHTTALDNVNVTIKRGGIYGFIGQNGAGKTTFMRIISGLSTPNSGSMVLFGKSNKAEIDMQRKRASPTPRFWPSWNTSTQQAPLRTVLHWQ